MVLPVKDIEMNSRDIVTAIGVLKTVMRETYSTELAEQEYTWTTCCNAVSVLQTVLSDQAFKEVNRV